MSNVGASPGIIPHLTETERRALLLVSQAYRPAALEAEGDGSSAKERRALLFEDFGASKKKRSLAASAANHVSADQAVGAAALTSWMGQGDDEGGEGGEAHEDATDVALAEGRRQLLPPFDAAATDVALAYEVRSMVGEAERGSLRRQAAALKEEAKGGDWVEALKARGWPACAVAALAKAVSSSDSEALADGLLLRHLLALHLKEPKRFGGALREEADALGMPADVLGCLLNKFGVAQDRGGWRLTKQGCDKLALHALVLALHVGRFTVRTAILSKDLEMPPPAVATLLRQVGARITADKSGDGHVATLSAPLVFPGRRRKRG